MAGPALGGTRAAKCFPSFFSRRRFLGIDEGLGVLLSVVSTLVPEVGKVVKIMSLPLLIISGVIFPITYIPHQFQQYVLWNPIVHGLESMRLSFFDGYHTIDGIDITYLWLWALSCLTLGLLMHIRFSAKLMAL